MKHFRYINTAIVIFCTLLSKSIAQEPDPNSFFPHSVGNIWEYDTPYWGITRFEIIKDSIGNDGRIYLFYGSIFDPLWSIDTLAAIVYDEPINFNWQYYKLSADSGDSWMVVYEDSNSGRNGKRALVKNRYPSIVFGIPTELLEIEYYELNWGDTVINEYSIHINTETLAARFGLILNWYEEPSPLNKILRGCVIDRDTFGIITSVEDIIKLPEDFYISQNFPNPFNPLTKIKYRLDSKKFITIKVDDLLGSEVATLVEAEKPAGVHEIIFDGSSLASGVYIYRLSTNKNTISKKMTLVK